MRYTTETFIQKAIEKHGDKFSYEKANYITSREKLIVTCPTHGDFEIEPASHLRGVGCKGCQYAAPSVRKYTQEEVLTKFQEVHGDLYDYSKFEYKGAKTRTTLICKEHGEFEQTPQMHMKGSGCPRCGRRVGRNQRTTQEFIEEAKEVHKGIYDYTYTHYEGADRDLVITCKTHGDFIQNASSHLKGRGCPKCSREQVGEALRNTPEEVINKVKENPRLKVTLKEEEVKDHYKGNTSYLKVECKKHGELMVKYTSLITNGTCPVCSKEKRIKDTTKTSREFIKQAIDVHGDRYIYSGVKYVTSHEKVNITCKTHGVFSQAPNQHLKGQGCPKCGNQSSKGEEEIAEFLKELGVSIETRDRKVLDGKEIDIWIPSLNIGIEYNGLIWHSEKFLKGETTHLTKTKVALQKGVRLVQIFEDEWNDKKNIVKSMLRNYVGKSERIHARKCEIREVTSKEARTFCDGNHLKGFTVGSHYIGLFYNYEMVAFMSFTKPRVNMGQKNFEEGKYELLRYCNKVGVSVVGGASKLLKYFETTYKPIILSTYSDRRYSEGDLYLSLGFKYVGESRPGYFYTRNGQFRENRFKFRKSELVKEGYDPNKSEREIMKDRGYYRIYDCGTNKFEKEYT